MLQPKSFFQAGLKIVGVLTIIWVFTQAVQVIFQFYSFFNQPEIMSNDVLSLYRFSLIFQIAIPILLMVIGIYLLISGDAIVQLAFRDTGEEDDGKIGTLFFPFMKLAGLVLIIYAIPNALQLISNAVFTGSVQGVDTNQQMSFIVLHLVSTVIDLLLGLYLLMNGSIFYKLGFSNKDNAYDSDQ